MIQALPDAQRFMGHAKRTKPAEDPSLTHTQADSPMGEAMRLHWQPVCMSSQLNDLPLPVRILSEDLVAFRDKTGLVGLLHKHCSHRGASLEFGRITDKGIRCCYHGWHYAHDGRLLDAPAEPANSPLLQQVKQGAYPVIEFKGLVFAYMGPPAQMPPFPHYDSMHLPDVELVPYAISHDCNWLQVHENLMDPLHAVFLHSRMGEIQLTEAWGEMPAVEWFEKGDRVCYLTSRQIGAHVWVRFNEVAFPNFGQVAGFWEDGLTAKFFERVGASRWTVPIDNTHCWIFGWRHFSPSLEAKGMGNASQVGLNQLDIYGQTGERLYEEMQRNTGDWEAEVSQGPIAIHAAENKGSSDRGVVMLRRHLAQGINSTHLPAGSIDGQTPTWTCNVVLHRPSPMASDVQMKLSVPELLSIGRSVKSVILAADCLSPPLRQAQIMAQLQALSKPYE